MSRKTFVLDINVLLHDPSALSRFENNDVVIPLIVLEELDKMKRFTDELGKNARNIIRFVDDLKGDVYKGVDIQKGVKLFINTGTDKEFRKDFPLPLDSSKHRILFTAFQLMKQGKEVVVLISKDFFVRSYALRNSPTLV